MKFKDELKEYLLDHTVKEACEYFDKKDTNIRTYISIHRFEYKRLRTHQKYDTEKLKEQAKEYSIRQLATMYNVEYSNMQNILKYRNIKAKKEKVYTTVEEMKKLHETMSDKEIALHFGKPLKNIITYMLNNHIRESTRRKYDLDKLKKEAETKTLEEMSIEYSITVSGVSKLLKRHHIYKPNLYLKVNRTDNA